MIDLHSHILPAVDDGPETEAQSLQMAAMYERAGYRIVAATPHMVPGTHWMPGVERIRSRVDALNRDIREKGMALEIVHGMEIALDPTIPDLLDNNRLLPLGNSSCLLIEPAFQQLPPGWETVIFTILAKGYAILVAHPERCAQLAAQPKLMERLIAAGVYLQLNWGSFLGRYGHAVRRTAHHMAARGWIHCLATDSHHPDGHDADQLHRARSMVENIIGVDNLRCLIQDNPRRLLAGEPATPISVTPAQLERKKRPWWRFWGANARRTNEVGHE